MAINDLFAFKSWVLELKQKKFVLAELPQEFSMSTDEAQVGWIVPFTSCDLNEYSRINLLVSWRNQNRESFISCDEVDFESTTKWFRTQVLENTNRQLFWILSTDKVHIGHIGILYDEEGERFELDSVLKGIDSDGGIMWLALRYLEKLMHEKFSASRLYLRVLESNQKAINFYRRNGYEESQNTEISYTINDSRKVIFMVKSI